MFQKMFRGMHGILGVIVATWFAIGAIFAAVSAASAALFFVIGDGSFWNIGVLTASTMVSLNIFMAFTRIVTWPYAMYQIINGDIGFFAWTLACQLVRVQSCRMR